MSFVRRKGISPAVHLFADELAPENIENLGFENVLGSKRNPGHIRGRVETLMSFELEEVLLEPVDERDIRLRSIFVLPTRLERPGKACASRTT